MELREEKKKNKAKWVSYLIISRNRPINAKLQIKSSFCPPLSFIYTFFSLYKIGNNDTCVHMLSILIVSGVYAYKYLLECVKQAYERVDVKRK